MDQNIIELEFNKSDSRIGGYTLGCQIYRNQVQDVIDYSKINIIVFPSQIIRVASSFTQGFFSEIKKAIGFEGIERQIIIKASSEKLVEDIKSDLFN